MRTILVSMMICLLAASLHAQQERIDRDPGHAGFVAVQGGPTRLNGALGMLVGAGVYGGLDPHTRVGMTAALLVNDVRGMSDASTRTLRFGYGGVRCEYIVNPEDRFQASLYALVGAGALLLDGPVDEPRTGLAKSGGTNVVVTIDDDTDAFMVAETGLGVETAVAEYLRLGVNAGYRVVHGVETEGVDNVSVGGPIAAVSLRFGLF